MPDYSPKMLLTSSLAFFMREKNEKSPEAAFEKLSSLYDANLISKTPEAESIYLKSLLAVMPDPAVFNELKSQVSGPLNRFVMDDWIEVINGLVMLRTTDSDILKMMSESYENFLYLKKHWDPVKVLLVEVSAAMKYRDLTLEQAIAEQVNLPRSDYTSIVNFIDVKYFLSEEMKIQLYQHARADVVLGRDNFPHGIYDEVSLREIATFHVRHPKVIYLQTDYGLRNLKLPAAECLQLLREHVSLKNITQLNEYVNLMPGALAQMETLVNGTRALTFEEAAVETFNNSSILTETYFKKLLSFDKKVKLKLMSVPSDSSLGKIFNSHALSAVISSLVSFATSTRSFLSSSSSIKLEPLDDTGAVSSTSQTPSSASSIGTALTTAASTIPQTTSTAFISSTASSSTTARDPITNVLTAPTLAPDLSLTHQYSHGFYRPNQVYDSTVSPTDFKMYELTGFTMTGCLVLVMLYNFRPRVITVPLQATGRLIMGLFTNIKNDRQIEPAIKAEQTPFLQNTSRYTYSV
jgi:hypothetical protein